MTDGLCAAVERHALLFRPRKNGSILYDDMCQVARATGKWPEDYEPLEPPESHRFVWDIFWEMRTHCKNGFSGPEYLSFADLDAWQRVRGLRLGNQLTDFILAMDEAYMRQWHKQEKGGKHGH